ncbi:unnamed protein product [Parnassius mnemosyne]
MERICCLQEQFDKDFSLLPDPPSSSMSLISDIDDYANRDCSLKLSFLRLYRMMHVTMLLTAVFFCNICLWFLITKKVSPRILQYRFRLSLPS